MDPEEVIIQRSGANQITWPELHDGVGDVDVQRYFEGQLPWPIEFETWVLPVGASEGPHTHDDDDPDGYARAREVYLIVDGSARITLNGTKHLLAAGDAFVAGWKVSRAVENIGTEPLRIVVVSDPGPPLH